MPTLNCPQCNRTADVAASLPSSEWVCPGCRVPLEAAAPEGGRHVVLDVRSLAQIALGVLILLFGGYLLADCARAPERLFLPSPESYRWLPPPANAALVLAVGGATTLTGYLRLRRSGGG